jgi:hypothetical protein
MSHHRLTLKLYVILSQDEEDLFQRLKDSSDDASLHFDIVCISFLLFIFIIIDDDDDNWWFIHFTCIQSIMIDVDLGLIIME